MFENKKYFLTIHKFANGQGEIFLKSILTFLIVRRLCVVYTKSNLFFIIIALLNYNII